jgi:hypothetical protein
MTGGTLVQVLLRREAFMNHGTACATELE